MSNDVLFDSVDVLLRAEPILRQHLATFEKIKQRGNGSLVFSDFYIVFIAFFHIFSFMFSSVQRL